MKKSGFTGRDRRARQIVSAPTTPIRSVRATPDATVPRFAIIGGGIAGVAAATIAAERGCDVTIFERQAQLGGRLRAWDYQLNDGSIVQASRGFHAFFRQYYNLRSLLRRIDPSLSLLRPVDDYPLAGPNGYQESFSGLPRTPPLNMLALVHRTSTMNWLDVMRLKLSNANELFAYDATSTYNRLDDISAEDFLASLNFPVEAKNMLFDVFARSFFNVPSDFSAAALVKMFHLYFLGSSEGILFDVAHEPFSTSIWDPFAQLLTNRGVQLQLNTRVTQLERVSNKDNRWYVRTSNGDTSKSATAFDAVIIATTVAGLQELVSESDIATPQWREQINQLDIAPPFAVWRFWLDRKVNVDRTPFLGTTNLGIVDNISVLERYEGESKRWSEATGGSVIEIHAYALPIDVRDESSVKREMLARLHELMPETCGAQMLDELYLAEQDCPGFPPGSHHRRVGVHTPEVSISLAGDYVKVDFPTALMEGAASTGFLAANAQVARFGGSPEPVWSPPLRGFAAPLVERLKRR